MPSIIPGYVYSLFAALLVGAIVVYSCSAATLNIKNEAANQQLKNINQYVAAQSLTLLSQTREQGQNTTQFLDIPLHVGNQIFWVQIANDSSGTWVETGFGSTVTSGELHTAIPANAEASGTFISGSGRAVLKCSFENQTATLMLTQE